MASMNLLTVHHIRLEIYQLMQNNIYIYISGCTPHCFDPLFKTEDGKISQTKAHISAKANTGSFLVVSTVVSADQLNMTRSVS